MSEKIEWRTDVTMVERVALEMTQEMLSLSLPAARILARAAIKAMRVPTDQMALVDADPEGATLIWQRMIDEALR